MPSASENQVRDRPARRGGGCLPGCLALIALAMLPALLVAGYGAWFFHRDMRRDPVVQLAGELVTRSGVARRMLGTPVRITGIEADGWSWTWGGGRSSVYVLSLSGPRGSGTLRVRARRGPGGPALDGATLTGPGGFRYDLMRHRVLPGSRDLTDTI